MKTARFLCCAINDDNQAQVKFWCFKRLICCPLVEQRDGCDCTLSSNFGSIASLLKWSKTRHLSFGAMLDTSRKNLRPGKRCWFRTFKTMLCKPLTLRLLNYSGHWLSFSKSLYLISLFLTESLFELRIFLTITFFFCQYCEPLDIKCDIIQGKIIH